MPERTCRFVTFGCKVNQYETQLVKEGLEQHGWREARDDQAADLCVVNTCTVTHEADSKARQAIRQIARNNPSAKTLVFGCYAARDPRAISELPGVFAVVEDPRELPDVLQRFGVADLPTGISRFDGHRRAFVKVQDGCLLKCTYCIIPSVRPGLRSRSPGDIVDEVRRLVDGGYHEIVLTGIHLGHYGVESTRARKGAPRFRLAHLIQQLDAIPGRWRMRLSSLEAAELDDEFLNAVSDCQRLCPHFHLCLQSGSDDVLARMRRRYRSTGFLNNIAALRRRFDRPALSTDVIIGFPGETDRDFEQTLRVCADAGFMKIHQFPFSRRRGTPAADYPDQVSPSVQAARIRQLGALESDLARQYHEKLLGMPLMVLVEARPARYAGWVQGTACRYATVELPGSAADVGQLVPVTAESVDHPFLIARRGVA